MLASIFNPHANYLQFISRRCIDELSLTHPIVMYFSDALSEKEKNFESWNITEQGLRLNFDACGVASCAEGDLKVEIPLEELRYLLNANGPLKSLSKVGA
jgi:hypothetical protein